MMGEYVNENYKKALEDLNGQLEKQKNKTCCCGIYTKEYRDSLEQEIKLLKEQKKILDEINIK